MNTLNKVRVEVGVAVTLGVLALGMSAAPARAESSWALDQAEISRAAADATARISREVAADLKVSFAQMLAAPRPSRGPRMASVIITESNAVVVEATRLPPLDTVVADAGKRAVRAAL